MEVLHLVTLKFEVGGEKMKLQREVKFNYLILDWNTQKFAYISLLCLIPLSLRFSLFL